MFGVILSLLLGWSLIAGTGQTASEYRATQPQCEYVWIVGRPNSEVLTWWVSAMPASWNDNFVLDPELGYWVHCGDTALPPWLRESVELTCRVAALPECGTIPSIGG